MALPLAPEAPLSLAEFEALAQREQGPLLRLAFRLTRDGEEARDLVQAALADAFEKRHGLRDAAAAPAWLRRLLVHRGLSHLRRRRLLASLRHLFLPEAPPPPPPDAPLEEAQAQRALLAEVARLPPRQATAFTLRYLEGLSLDEVAHALGIDRGTVKVHLQRALTKLRALPHLRGETP